MPNHKSTRRRFLQTTAAAGASLPLLHSLAYAAPAKDAWEELFDGQTLKGWHKNPTKIGHGDGGENEDHPEREHGSSSLER